MNKTILVCGAGGFIGTHLANDLKSKGHNVIGVDIKHPLYEDTQCDEFYKQDLRDPSMVDFIFTQHDFDEAITWYFIGPLQSNKTRPVAENFDWVQSVERLKIALSRH